MAKKQVVQNENEKVMTKYDRKVQKRKEEALKAARSRKISIIVLIVLAVALLTTGIVTGWTKYDRIHHEYIVVDNESVSEIEFNYYYTLAKQNMLSQSVYGTMTYADYFKSYLGYDNTKTDNKQAYSSSTDYTWYDYFANNALSTIKEYKSLTKAANENNFDYTTVEDDYQSFCDDLKKAADTKGVSVKEYYKDTFGKYATESNLEGIIKTYLKAAAYQDKLRTDLAASEDEISTYYEENKDDWDNVDFRSFIIAAETAGDDTSLATAKAKADKMAANVTNDSTFESYCRNYATDEQAEKYEADDGSLTSDAMKNTLDAPIADWLFDQSRKEGDITVIEDSNNSQYYVVYFKARDYDKTNDDSIASQILSKKYSDLISGYADNMSVVNKKNRIKMLNK
jgi:hypothetical protein